MKVKLQSSGKLQLVRAVKDVLDLGLKEAKDLVDEQGEADRKFCVIVNSEKTEEQIKAIAKQCGVSYTIVPTKDRPYLAKFKNGAEYRFFAPGMHAAEKVAESRAKELETDVKELIDVIGKMPKNVPTTEVIEPWVGTRFEVNEEGSITMVVHFATPKMPQIRAALLDAQIHSNVLPWIEDNGQIIEITREVQTDTNVLALAGWVKKVSAFINLVEEKVDADKALEEFIKDVFED